MNIIIVLAKNINLDRSGDPLVVHLLDMDDSLREEMLVVVFIFLEKLLCGAVGLCVDDELRDVLTRKNRGIGAMETRCARSDELGDGGDAAVQAEHVCEGVRHLRGLVKACGRVEIDLDGKDRTGGHRHELDIHPREHQKSKGDGGDSGENRERRVLEALVLHEVIALLKSVEQDVLELGYDVA